MEFDRSPSSPAIAHLDAYLTGRTKSRRKRMHHPSSVIQASEPVATDSELSDVFAKTLVFDNVASPIKYESPIDMVSDQIQTSSSEMAPQTLNVEPTIDSLRSPSHHSFHSASPAEHFATPESQSSTRRSIELTHQVELHDSESSPIEYDTPSSCHDSESDESDSAPENNISGHSHKRHAGDDSDGSVDENVDGCALESDLQTEFCADAAIDEVDDASVQYAGLKYGDSDVEPPAASAAYESPKAKPMNAPLATPVMTSAFKFNRIAPSAVRVAPVNGSVPVSHTPSFNPYIHLGSVIRSVRQQSQSAYVVAQPESPKQTSNLMNAFAETAVPAVLQQVQPTRKSVSGRHSIKPNRRRSSFLCEQPVLSIEETNGDVSVIHCDDALQAVDESEPGASECNEEFDRDFSSDHASESEGLSDDSAEQSEQSDQSGSDEFESPPLSENDDSYGEYELGGTPPAPRPIITPQTERVARRRPSVSDCESSDESFDDVKRRPKHRHSRDDFDAPSSDSCLRGKGRIPELLGDEIKLLPLLKGSQVYRGRALVSRRDELASELFSLFNRVAFDDKLPADTEISWNPRLTKTAGLTSYKLNRSSMMRTCSIQLSTKVVDDSDRLQWTVMHEMCHAAQWCIDNSHRPPHGAAFKKWSQIAMRAFPRIPVTTYHDFEINYKYRWQCTGCERLEQRHSKSIDEETDRCAYCFGAYMRLK